jgi:hypothetical protein
VKHRVYIYDQALSDIVQTYSKVLFNYPHEKVWNQKGVSLSRRVEASDDFKQRLDTILLPTNLDQYIVPADDSAPTRCIDGRILAHWEESHTLQERHLGPKVAGGTAHAALAYRIVDTENLRENLIFEEDIKIVIDRFKKIGIGFGGHIDDHQEGSNTGCGAVDNINLILDRLQHPEPQEQLRGLTQLILGEDYDGSVMMNEIFGRMLYLDALKPSYMPKENDDPNGEFLYKKTIVSTLRQNADTAQDTVPALVGPHHEVALVLNFVANTTFDTDRFSHDNNNEIQVFTWDVWHMYEEAQRLYKYNMHEAISVQQRAIENRMKYLTTRTLLAIATLMVLTDGSLRLVTASPDHN